MDTMTSSNEDARDISLGRGNYITINRRNVVMEADRLSQDEEFL